MRVFGLGLSAALVMAPALTTAQPTGDGPLSFQAQGGYLHQFETDVDGGGNVAVDRAFAQVGGRYTFDPRTSVGLALGYRFDSFDFGGGGTFAGARPWSDVQELRLSAPIRFGVSERVDGFVTPQLAWSAETGAGFGDAVTGGALLGATYAFHDRLRLGAGLGVLSQIEDDVQVFPLLLIDWRIADAVSLTTNPGLGLTRGPTLSLNWQARDELTLATGFGYEKYRFRTDDGGGVGQERGLPIFVSATYEPFPQVTASLFGGVQTAGELRLEDSSGNLVAKEDYDTTGFVGAALRVRF